MWYFAWVLGVTLAALAGILNGIWLEMHLEDENHGRKRPGPAVD